MLSGKRHEKRILKKIDDYVASVHPEDRNWIGTLESLRSFIFENIDEGEREVQLTIRCFERLIEEMKKRFATSLSKYQEIHMEIWLGQCFEKFGAWDKALSAYEKTLTLCDDETCDHLKIEAIRYMGHIYLMRNQYQKALEAYQNSLTLSQNQDDQDAEAYAFSSIGIVYFEQGNLSKSSHFWEKGLELAEKLNETRLIAQINNNLGALESILGNWEKALSHYGKSATLFEKNGESRGLAETYHNMAMTYADVKRWSESNTYYEKSYDIAKEIGDIRLQALVKLNRVELYLSISDVYVSLALCNQALQTFMQLEDHLGEAETYKFLGILYTKKQEYKLASAYFKDCIDLAKKYSNPLLEGEATFEFGKMHKLDKNADLARKHLKRALRIFKELKAEKDAEEVEAELSSMGA